MQSNITDNQTSKPYRPSNGTEGDSFMARFCENCDRFDNDEPCMILGATMAYHIDDPEYPKEWIEDEYGVRCTAYIDNGELEEKYRCELTPDLFGEKK